MGFTPTQKAMALAPKFTGFLSLCSSTFIIQYVLRDRKRRKLAYHRLLLGMSISDFFGSLMCFLSTWPIPRGEAYLAAGTVQTCAAAGFFNQTAALCTPTYNISLAIYYILVIVCGWKEHRVVKIEKYLHALPILAGFGTGLAALFMKLYNGAGWICWIATGLPNHPERHNPDFGIYRLAFLYVDAWVIICVLAVVMVIIYASVLKQEKKLDRYMTKLSKKKRNNSRKIRNQAFLYVGCMYMTWLFGSIFRLMQFAGKKPPDAIIVLFVLFFPLQGFFNLIVYMYPRIARYREKGTPVTASFVHSIRSTIRRSNFNRLKSPKEKAGNTCFSQEESTAVGPSASSTAFSKKGEAHNYETKVKFAAEEEDNEKGSDEPVAPAATAMGTDPALEVNDADVLNEEDGNDHLERDAMDELVRIVEA